MTIRRTYGSLTGALAHMAREVGEGERAEAQGLRREGRRRYEQGREDRTAAAETARAQERADAAAAQTAQIAKEGRALADFKTRETELQKNRETLALLRQPPRKTSPREWMDAAITGDVVDLMPPGKPKQRMSALLNKYGREPSDQWANLLQPEVKKLLSQWASGGLSARQKQEIAEDTAARKEAATEQKGVFDREVLVAKSLLDLAGDAHDRAKARFTEGKTEAMLGRIGASELTALESGERAAWDDYRVASKALRDLYGRGPGATDAEPAPTTQPTSRPAAAAPTTGPATQPAAAVSPGDPAARVPTGAPPVPSRQPDKIPSTGYRAWIEDGWEITQGDDVTAWADTREGSPTEDWDWWLHAGGRKFTIAPDGAQHEGWVYPGTDAARVGDAGQPAGGEMEIPDSMEELAEMIRAEPGLMRRIRANALTVQQRDELAVILAEMEVTP